MTVVKESYVVLIGLRNDKHSLCFITIHLTQIKLFEAFLLHCLMFMFKYLDNTRFFQKLKAAIIYLAFICKSMNFSFKRLKDKDRVGLKSLFIYT